MKKSFTQPFWKMMYSNHSPKGLGFTLIELLIVLVIIGILATVAIPQYQRIVLKTKMMKRVSVLEQIRLAEIAYKNETGNYWTSALWLEPSATAPGDPQGLEELKQKLGVELPRIIDYKNKESSFVVLQEGVGLSSWFSNDPRFEGRYVYVSYASQGTDGDGDACIIVCYDDALNVKRMSIKYGADGTVDDIVLNG